MERSKIIIKTSALGIIINAVLVTIKVVIGLASGSIAIVLDAVNNFSDALSSFINIIATMLANRAPDKKHPYGYGRIEYIAAVLISFIILIAGGTAFKESVENIINHDVAVYEWSTVVILLCAVFVKFFMAKRTQRIGYEMDSHALIASGQEAFFDFILSAGTLLAALISLLFKVSLEGWLGIIISIGILKAGGTMLGETLHIIIGVRQDKELSLKLKDYISKYPGVNGVFDIILHDYGPAQHIGTAHIEVDECMNAKDIHVLTSSIVDDIYNEFSIVITIGIYSSVSSDPEAIEVRKEVSRICADIPEITQIHGFYLDKGVIGIDLVMDFKVDASKIRRQVEEKLKALFPEYKYRILLDLDFSE